MKPAIKSPERLEWERIKAQATADARSARSAREAALKPRAPRTWRYCRGGL